MKDFLSLQTRPELMKLATQLVAKPFLQVTAVYASFVFGSMAIAAASMGTYALVRPLPAANGHRTATTKIDSSPTLKPDPAVSTSSPPARTDLLPQVITRHTNSSYRTEARAVERIEEATVTSSTLNLLPAPAQSETSSITMIEQPPTSTPDQQKTLDEKTNPYLVDSPVSKKVVGGPGSRGAVTNPVTGPVSVVARTPPQPQPPVISKPTASMAQYAKVLSEPNANDYITEDAKKNHVAGVIRVKIHVLASGVGQVVGLSGPGLGHGLDEASLTVAKLIRWRPALDASGHPIDSDITIGVRFQLVRVE